LSKKTLYIATVGEHNKPIEIGLARHRVDKIILLPSKDTTTYATNLKTKIQNEIGIPTEIIEVDPFDLFDVLKKTLEIIKNHKDYDPLINMSCGTRIMSIGAQLAADIEHGKVIYIIHQENKPPIGPIEIPTRKLSLTKKLGKTALKILKELKKKEAKSLTELAERLSTKYKRVKKSTVSQIIKKLEKLGMVIKEPDGPYGRKRIKLTGLAELYLDIREKI